MTADYSGRAIHAVNVSGIELGVFEDGGEAASAVVSMSLTARNDPTIYGPGITAHVDIEIPHTASAQDIERRALETVHAVLKRFVSEDPSALYAFLEKRRADQIAAAPLKPKA